MRRFDWDKSEEMWGGTQFEVGDASSMVTYLHIEQSFRALGPPFSATGIFLQAIGGCQKRLPKDRLRTDGCAERLSCQPVPSEVE